MARPFLVVDTTINRDYPQRALDQLAGLDVIIESRPGCSEAELIADCRDADIVLVTAAHVTRKVLRGLPQLKGVVRYGVGLDRIDQEAAAEFGVAVANVRDFCTDEMADHALMLILGCVRHLYTDAHSVRQGEWKGTERPVYRLRGRCAGVIGFGAIGRALARRLRAMGMRVIAFDPYLNPKHARALEIELTDLDSLLSRSDVVSIHCALTEETRGMIGVDQLRAMKPTAVLINTSRGGIVDEHALAETLRSGEIAAAGLDVLDPEPPPADHPLLAMDNALITPHVGWRSIEATEDVIVGVFEHIARILKGS